MGDPRNFQFDLPETGRPASLPLAERLHPEAWSATPSCTSPRPGNAVAAVRAIVIHATAGSTSAGAISVMREKKASFHWLIPSEREEAHGQYIWATAPERSAAWHVRRQCAHPAVCDGAYGVNGWSLGVEIVNRQDGADAFSRWQIEATAMIVRYAWAKYPNLIHVVSHARLDPERRNDPGANFPWADFREIVLSG